MSGSWEDLKKAHMSPERIEAAQKAAEKTASELDAASIGPVPETVLALWEWPLPISWFDDITDVEFEPASDGRWRADIWSIPGAVAFGTNRQEAYAQVLAFALRATADKLEGK